VNEQGSAFVDPCILICHPPRPTVAMKIKKQYIIKWLNYARLSALDPILPGRCVPMKVLCEKGRDSFCLAGLLLIVPIIG
jgi:hypothetical protein